MAQVTRQHSDAQQKTHQTKPAKPVVEPAPALAPETPVQARIDPRAMTPRNLVALQRTVGNRQVSRMVARAAAPTRTSVQRNGGDESVAMEGLASTESEALGAGSGLSFTASGALSNDGKGLNSAKRMGEGVIQAKLTVNAPGDQYEQEADAVAAQVMTMRAPAQRQAMPEEDELHASRKPLVQRATEEDELQAKPLAQRQAMPEEGELHASRKPFVQRKGDGSFETDEVFALRVNASRGGGSPLPDETREFMESRFSADFSGVRVHTGSEAARLSRDAQAQAFTHGSDIYFNEGKYNPDTGDGKRLLAHELTHTIQQTGGIQRKVDYQFIGNVGAVAGVLKDRDKQFKKIMKAYKQYTKAVDLDFFRQE
jgi:hypothetical protein